MGDREDHSALHLLGGSLVGGLEAFEVQAQHWRQLPDGHLLCCTALALTPAPPHKHSREQCDSVEHTEMVELLVDTCFVALHWDSHLQIHTSSLGVTVTM